MDTVKGTSMTRPDPEGCAGGLLAVGGGEILYECVDSECPEQQVVTCLIPELKGLDRQIVRLVVVDIATGMQHPVAGENDIPSGGPPTGSPSTFNEVGSQWLAGNTNIYHAGGIFFLNWHSGRLFWEEEEPDTASRDFEDLNSEELLQPMCSPLMRGLAPPIELRSNTKFVKSSDYAPPFLVEERFKPGPSDYRLYLRRCGSPHQELIGSSKSPDQGVGVGAGLQASGGVLSYGLGYLWHLDARERPWIGRSYRLTGLPSPKPREMPGGLEQHTSTMVFETIERAGAPERVIRYGLSGDTGPERYEVWVGRLPWTRRRN
jgi:hypothetical protein